MTATGRKGVRLRIVRVRSDPLQAVAKQGDAFGGGP